MVKIWELPILDGHWTHLDDFDLEKDRDMVTTWVEDETVRRLLTEWSPRPHYHCLPQCRVLILKVPDIGQARVDDLIAIRFYLHCGKLVSICRRQTSAVNDVMREVQDRGTSLRAVDVIALVTQKVIAAFRDLTIELIEELDTLEDRVINPRISVPAQKLLIFRRKIIALKRAATPQHRAIEEFVDEEDEIVPEPTRQTMAPVLSSAAKVDEILDSMRQRAEGVADAIDAESRRTNEKSIYLLTLAAGVFLPLSIVAALFGANVGGIPFASHPNGFWLGVIMFVSAIIIAVASAWLLKLARGGH